ncbi:MAG: hypothetical protein AB7O52_09150 [Planctomycetota bacterium]
MSEEARTGTVIPGYQPIEKLGRCPSYGTWLRALQTRLDRRVLLKVLPDGSADAHRYFSREIQVLVQLDGQGALRVIDEGTAGPVRYLVVDEADGVPLVANEAPQWAELARTCEGLFRRVGALGFVLLPLAAGSFRRLPSAHYAVADLGVLVPFGEPLPKLPSVPPELVGAPAEVAQNSRFVGATLSALANLHPGCPARLRKAVAALDRRGVRDESGDPLAGSPLTKACSTSRSAMPRVLLAASILLAAPLLWIAIRRPSEPAPPLDGSAAAASNGGLETSTPAVPEAGDPAPPPTPVDDSAGAQRVARETEADQRYFEIVGSDDGVALARILDAPRREQLLALRESFPSTEAAERAHLWVSLSDAAAADEAWGWWIPARARCRAHLREGDFAAVVAELSRGPRSLPPGLAAEKQEIEAATQRDELATRLTTEGRLTAWCAARDYSAAVEALDSLRPRLTEVAVRWADDWKSKIASEAEGYERAVADLARAQREALADSVLGGWVAARARFTALAGLEAFGELADRGARWERWLAAAEATAAAVTDGLSKLQASKRNLTFELTEGDSVRGRVAAIDGPIGFTVDVDGKVGDRSLRWPTLHLSTFAELVEDDPRASPAALAWLLFLLGERSRALAEVEPLTPRPEWWEAARAIQDESRQARVVALLAEGDLRLAAGRASELLELYEELDGLLVAAERKAERPRLVAWLTAYWRARGPQAIFAGAAQAKYEGGTLELEYDFKEDGALADWQVGDGRSKLELAKRGTVLVRGSVFLSPSSSWRDAGLGVDAFQGDLRIDTELQATETSTPPNLNVVLFSSLPLGQRRGVLVGLGFQPRQLHQLTTGADNPPVLLPANVIGAARDLEAGDGRTYAEIKPKVVAGRVVAFAAGSSGDVCSLWKDGTLVKECPNPVTAEQRRGTVEFRTYDSHVLIRSVRVRGTLRPAWWAAWIDRQVAARLGP